MSNLPQQAITSMANPLMYLKYNKNFVKQKIKKSYKNLLF